MSALISLSEALSGAAESSARAVVSIEGERRRACSGVRWRPGLIVTVEHALERDDELTVTTADGREQDATLVGRDATTDLALLRIAETSGEISPKADASTLRIGHVVLAVGRFGNDGPSVSMGIVSALGDAWTTWRGGRIDRFIRADLNAYPGYSGGALVDARGAVVGINTSGLSRHWGLTVPCATVDRVVDALLSKGRIARGYLGIGLQSVRIPEHVVRKLGLAHGGGAIVVAVEPDSPAESAGLLIGDVVTALDGVAIADVEDVHAALGPERVGAVVPMRVIRAGAITEVRATVGERPDTDA